MSNETWSKWASIAEIISSVAILATLVFLTIETRQNTDAILSTTRQASLEAELGIIQRQIDYPHIRPALISGDMDSLTPGQREQVINAVIGVLRIRENFWLQHENGVMDDQTWNVYRNSMLLFIKNSPVVAEQWELAKDSGFYHPGFIAEINQAQAENNSDLK